MQENYDNFDEQLPNWCTDDFDIKLAEEVDKYEAEKDAWIGSLAAAFSMIISPLAANLINRFGARPVSIVGGFVAALGLFLSSLVTSSMPVMYVTFSVIYGFGACVIYTSYYDIVPKYFKKRLAIANGVLCSGSAMSTFVMSPIIETLITNVGWRNAFKALSGFAMVAGMLGVSFSPHVEKDVSPQTQRSVMVVREEIEKKPLIRNGCFIIICLYSFIFQLGNTIPLLHLGRFAQDSGLTPSQAANLYTGYGIASMIGRLLAGKICEFKFVNPSYVLFFFTLMSGTSTIVCPSVNTFIGLIIYSCINGLCDGFHVTPKYFMMMVECSAEQRTTAFGCLFFVTALGWGIGSPLGGFIADETGSYILTFYTSGVIVLFSAGVIMATKCFKKTTKTELELLDEEDDVIEKVTVV